MSKTFILLAFLVVASQQMLRAQTDTLRRQARPFADVSLIAYVPYGDPTYFFSSSILFGGKKKGWQNSLHLDVQTLDLGGSYDGVKNFYSFQFGKNYAFERKWFIAKNCSGVGPFMYQRVLPGIGARSYGIVISQSLEVGISLKKVNVSAGFYLAVGYGYFKAYYELSENEYDPFKFTAVSNPFVKVTFKK